MLLGSGNLLLMGGAFFLYKKYQAAQAEAERLGSRESGPLPTERPAGTAGSTGRTDDLTRRSEEEEREREREHSARRSNWCDGIWAAACGGIKQLGRGFGHMHRCSSVCGSAARIVCRTRPPHLPPGALAWP